MSQDNALPTIVAEFRAALRRGELVVQKCGNCSRLNMYPRHACPFCQSQALGWQRVSGRGKLHSFTVLRAGAPQGFEADLPYALGVIKLAEGVQLLARLSANAAGDWQHYQCDDPVEFVATDAVEVERRPCATFRRVT
jgi:uncharacterized OB-fold protein